MLSMVIHRYHDVTKLPLFLEDPECNFFTFLFVFSNFNQHFATVTFSQHSESLCKLHYNCSPTP